MNTTLTRSTRTDPGRSSRWPWLSEPTPRRSRILGPPQRADAAEKVEREAWKDLVCAAPAPLGERLGLRCEARSGVLSLRADNVDSLLVNRAFGLGAETDGELVKAVLAGYERANIRRFWLHVGPGGRDTEIGRWLTRRGMAPFRRSMVKLARSLDETVPSAPTTLEIRPVRGAEASAAGRLLAGAFDMPTTGGELLASLVGRDRWSVLGAFQGSALAAVGTLFVDREVGCLVMSATDPDHRRRGAHQALMAARLEDARRSGCRLVTTETGEPLAGSDDPSLRNMSRFGFAPVALRESWGPVGLTWA